MKNIWKLFRGDLGRLTKNIATVIIAAGLILLPSLFTWFNTLACWDVFGNTGNLMVAVANDDTGYSSDLMPIEINIGDSIVSSLRENDQMHWVFTDSEDAVDGASSGKYYAAVVIPENFSQDMMTFYSDDMEHAKIIYYSNEKKNAIAPKVIDQGADQVSVQVNKVFTEKLTESALGIMSSLSTYATDNDLLGKIENLATHMERLSEQMSSGAMLIRSYSSLAGSSKDLVQSSTNLMQQAQGAAKSASDTMNQMKDSSSSITEALSGSTSALQEALEQTSAGYEAVSQSIDTAFDSAGTVASDSSSQLRSTAAGVRSQATTYQNIITTLTQMMDSSQSEILKGALKVTIAELQTSKESMDKLATSLETSADQIDLGVADVEARRQDAKDKAANAKASIENAKNDYNTNLKPQLDDLIANIQTLAGYSEGTISSLDSAVSSLVGETDSVSNKLNNLQTKLDAAATNMDNAASHISEFAKKIKDAISSGNIDLLKSILASDTTSLAESLSAPIDLDRHALYKVNTFGSGMSPLYTSLALWIGALLIMVAIKVNPSQSTLDKLNKPRLPQIFIGRFGVIALLSIAQSTVMALGNMFFLEVQVENPLLYLLSLWFSGLVFAFIIYTLVASLANLGKAIAVIVLILQVTGAGGSFPLQLFPDFFQSISPFLPATYAINAMREAMFGLHAGDFWMYMSDLAMFIIPFAIIGLILRNPFVKLVNFFVERIEESKIA